MSKRVKVLIIVFAFALLALIKINEDIIYYDPFISYFKNNYFNQPTPNYTLFKLLTNTTARYLINSLISIFILYIAFQKKSIIRFSILFYSLAFIILITCYSIILFNFSIDLKQVFFYIRRFLIQPIFILILLPAFYYQNRIQNNHK